MTTRAELFKQVINYIAAEAEQGEEEPNQVIITQLPDKAYKMDASTVRLHYSYMVKHFKDQRRTSKVFEADEIITV